ncbi:8936_t:CDS:2 [Gigaspora margarita]|uniref:8936_t:CDS:1 n=1 Tax=Gigaspora margarita TaxID=4874 RepID=A0ABN7V8M7_GIGMA|nr:8936_t:CDS:2 [Gigaspora margarita]
MHKNGKDGCGGEEGEYRVQEVRRDEVVKNKVNCSENLRLEMNEISEYRADAIEVFVNKNMKMVI